MRVEESRGQRELCVRVEESGGQRELCVRVEECGGQRELCVCVLKRVGDSKSYVMKMRLCVFVMFPV